jgi:hypothetical protein
MALTDSARCCRYCRRPSRTILTHACHSRVSHHHHRHRHQRRLAVNDRRAVAVAWRRMPLAEMLNREDSSRMSFCVHE